jgi:Neuraminidase (sialidase)
MNTIASARIDRRALLAAFTGAAALPARLAAAEEVTKKHVVVFKEPGRFGGWPANNGIWSWGNEILVGFSNGAFKRTERGHAIDGTKPSYLRFGRSKDGGETWQIEVPSFLTAEGKEPEPVESPGGFDFKHPDSAVAFRMVSSRTGYSRFYYSNDRGRTWKGPYKIPTYDRTGIASRTDYIVNGNHDLMAFMTAHKVNGREGRVFNVRTKDGGKTWDFVSWIGPEPNGFSIMPSTVRISENRILTTLRCKDGDRHWIESWVSDDDGKTWKYLNEIASTGGSVGNPPSMITLQDGRLAMTYGFRSAPFGMRARLSSDKGITWGSEIVLRDDAGCWDLGYPRTVQRPDGKIVTIYYHNDHPDQERYIAATIWDPGRASARG